MQTLLSWSGRILAKNLTRPTWKYLTSRQTEAGFLQRIWLDQHENILLVDKRSLAIIKSNFTGVTCTYTEALIRIRIIWRLAVCWAWGLPTKRQLPCCPQQCSIRPRVYARKRTTTPTWSSEFGNWMSALGFRRYRMPRGSAHRGITASFNSVNATTFK